MGFFLGNETSFPRFLGMSQPSIEFYNDALDALQAGDLHGARSAVENSLTENPSDAETWQLYVIVLNALGLSAEARKASEKAQSLGVSEADMLLLKAAQAGSIGDHAAMLSHYEEALRISPERADIHAGYALALLEGDQSEAALAAAQKACLLYTSPSPRDH
jgi:tetratricopeptide (TPR) repeat protein